MEQNIYSKGNDTESAQSPAATRTRVSHVAVDLPPEHLPLAALHMNRRLRLPSRLQSMLSDQYNALAASTQFAPPLHKEPAGKGLRRRLAEAKTTPQSKSSVEWRTSQSGRTPRRRLGKGSTAIPPARHTVLQPDSVCYEAGVHPRRDRGPRRRMVQPAKHSGVRGCQWLPFHAHTDPWSWRPLCVGAGVSQREQATTLCSTLQ